MESTHRDTSGDSRKCGPEWGWGWGQRSPHSNFGDGNGIVPVPRGGLHFESNLVILYKLIIFLIKIKENITKLYYPKLVAYSPSHYSPNTAIKH